VIARAPTEPVIGPFHREWADLADRTNASPFVQPGWVLPWAELRGFEVELAAVRRDGTLVAAMPMVRTRKGKVTPTDWHTPLFEAIAADDAALTELAETLVARHHRYLSLGFLHQDGPTHRAFIRSLRDAGYRVRQRTVLRSPYIHLTGSWEDFLAAWPAKRRSDLGRRRRRLEEQGVVSLETHDGTGSLEDLLTEGFEVEASGWKGTRGTAIRTEGTESLYRRVAAWAAAEGKLRLGFLRLDGRAIAFDYCFEIGTTHYLVKTGFRPEYSAYAPGKLLRAHMIEAAYAAGFETYDFVGDADPWKMEWTDTASPIVTVEAYSPRPLGVLARTAGLIERGGRWAGRRLRFRT